MKAFAIFINGKIYCFKGGTSPKLIYNQDSGRILHIPLLKHIYLTNVQRERYIYIYVVLTMCHAQF